MERAAEVSVVPLTGGKRGERPLVEVGLHRVVILIVLCGTLFWSVVAIGVAALV